MEDQSICVVRFLQKARPMICPECDGLGTIPQGCPSCNGSGEGMTDGSDCYLCRGSGELKAAACMECYGTGRIICWSCGEDKNDMLEGPYGLWECQDCLKAEG